MAVTANGVTIGDLTQTSTMSPTDLLEIERGGQAYAITYESWFHKVFGVGSRSADLFGPARRRSPEQRTYTAKRTNSLSEFGR